MKKVLFATENASKAKRFKDKLLKNNIEIITINDLAEKISVEENGKDAIENALIKARAYSKIENIPVFAMDDNLYIDEVPEEKQPGMYVRRVNGKRLSDDEMIEYYSSLAHEYGKEGKLTCRWVYGIAVINNGIESTYTWNKEDFYIVDCPSNKINPGYPLNTISVNKKLNKYFTDLTNEDKLELASIRDIDSVLELYSERIKWFKDNSIKQWTNYLNNNPKSVFVEKITNKDYYIVKKNNEIVAGFELSTSGKEWRDNTTSAYYIYKLVTKVGYKNIGDFIFKECKKLAIKNGKKNLRLHCIRANQKLNNIYKSHDFKLMGYYHNEKYRYALWEYRID